MRLKKNLIDSVYILFNKNFEKHVLNWLHLVSVKTSVHNCIYHLPCYENYSDFDIELFHEESVILGTVNWYLIMVSFSLKFPVKCVFPHTYIF